MASDDVSLEPVETHEWVRQVFEGDLDGLAQLFAYYRPRLRQLLSVRMHPAISARVDPSDVLQEVYLDADQQLDGYLRDRKVAFYVWLRALTWQRLIKIQRRHLGAQQRSVHREVVLPADSTFELVNQLMGAESSPSQLLLRAELQRRVQTAIANLKDEDREAIMMRDFEGLSNAEMAQALGITESGATRRYGRAILRLKLVLDAM